MKDLSPTPKQLTFLQTFFGTGNTLRWNEFENGELNQTATDLLTTLVADYLNARKSVLLPRVAENGLTDWYCCARNAGQARALSEQLRAFLGPSYTDFRGQRALLDNTDPIESAVANQFGSHVFRLRVTQEAHRNTVRNRLFTMRALQDRSTGRGIEQVKPIGRLLRDLEMALFAGNEPNAWQIHEQLRARGRLSSRNLLFLQVIVLASFEHWQQILGLPQYPSLLNVRRPVRVSNALLKANYRVHFAPFEQKPDAVGCIEAFTQKKQNFGTLLRSVGEARDAFVTKILILQVITSANPNADRLRELKQQYKSSGGDNEQWIDALCQSSTGLQGEQFNEQQPAASPSATELSVTELAKLACEQNDFALAMSLLLDCAPSVPVLRQILSCAFELNNLNSTVQAIEFVDAAPEAVRDEALAMRSASQWYETLCEETGIGKTQAESGQQKSSFVPTKWHQWIEQLNASADWPEAMEVLQTGMASWDLATYLDDVSARQKLASALTASRSQSSEATLRLATPHLLSAFIPDGQPIREFKELYLSFALLLSLDDEIGKDDLTALATLTEAILDSDPVAAGAKNEFADLMDMLETAWARIESSRHLDWTLTILDLLIAFNVSNRTSIDGFINALVDSFRKWSGRVRIDQWDFLEQLFEELGQTALITGLRPEEAEGTETVEFDATALAGKSIAIYTLTERIGRQAQQMISKRFEGVKVHLLHVKASTDRLVQLAQSADIFIVNTWDAKHAATGAIKQNRNKEQITLMPRSKSAGSIFRQLLHSATCH